MVRLRIRGPKIIPLIPKINIPPSTTKKVESGCIFALPPISIGLAKLSTEETANTPQIPKNQPKAEASPCKMSASATGAQIIEAPTYGIKEVKTITVVQKIT